MEEIMARKVTTDDIKQFNELYYKYKSYAEVARITGWSSSTVSKYVDKNYTPVIETDIIRFNPKTDLPEFNSEIFAVENFGDLCVLSDDELLEMIDFRKELAI
jgi:hypothetical protein